MQRDYITELETQLSVKNDEVAALSASLAGHNAAKEVHREALDKLTNECGMAWLPLARLLL